MIVHEAKLPPVTRRACLAAPLAWFGAGLSPAFAQTRPASPVLIGGTGSGLAPVHSVAAGLRLGVSFVPNLGSGGGIKALQAGAVDLALSARPASDAERAAGLVDRPWFRTPFIWCVQATVPVQRVTTAELVALYAGRTARWPDGEFVRLVLRPEGDSDSQLMRSAHPQLAQALALASQRPGMRVAMTDDDAITDIERISGALGASSLAMVRSHPRAVRVLELDGVAPDTGTLWDGRYRLAKTVYLITRGTPGEAVQAVLQRLATASARDSFLKLGCVPLTAG
ncbi:MAG: substrate-binding domain-containing protein [Burkholderiaceae bacterium]